MCIRDRALALNNVAKSIKVVHRRNKFRAAPESVAKLQDLHEQGVIELVVPYQLHTLQGEGGQLSSVDIIDKEEGVRRLTADILLPFYGLATSLGPIAEWGLDLDKNTLTVDPTTCQTNSKGIYAIGDIVSYENKLKLILTGFSEAAFAAHHIYNLLSPDKPLHFEYSTTKGVP